MRSFALAALLSLLPLACMASQTCPCGQQYDRDPFDPDAELFVGVDHDESDHCFCRCGTDPEERRPPSHTCASYEGPCEQAGGQLSRAVCK